MSQVPSISFAETRLYPFPVHDFNGQASGAQLTPSGFELQLGTEGYWALFGISGTMCFPGGEGGLFDGSDININIYNITQGTWLFNQTQDYQIFGSPIEHVAGKWGNPCWFDFPKTYKPGDRLMLYASQFSGATPTDRSPLYVMLHMVLTKEPL